MTLAMVKAGFCYCWVTYCYVKARTYKVISTQYMLSLLVSLTGTVLGLAPECCSRPGDM